MMSTTIWLLMGIFVQATRSIPECYMSRNESSYVFVQCESSSPDSVVVLRLDRVENELKLECKNGAYSCPMMYEAKAALGKFASSTSTLDTLKVEGCALNESLSCPLNAINSTDTKKLVLVKTQGGLLPIHMEALKSVKQLEIEMQQWNDDKSATKIPYEALSYLPELLKFKIQYGHFDMSERDPERKQIPQLKKLELSNGRLEVLPAGGFNNTPNVTQLSLWGNEIVVVDSEAFQGLSKLELLNLNVNDISILPPEVFQPCRRLKNLYIWQNKLKVLQSDLFADLTSLEEIEISQNKVEMIIEDKTFANLTSLKKLKMQSSKINFLHGEVFRGSSIEVLKLGRNSITELAAGTFSNADLKILDLSGNKIENLRRDVFVSENLNILDLSENCIRSVSTGVFRSLALLTSLNLNHNKLEELVGRTFDGLRSLSRLDLSFNLLTTLNLSVFEGLPKLNMLDLSHNLLTVLHSSTFNVLISLEVLVLSHNKLHMPQIDSPFNGLLQLQTLDLQHNLVDRVCWDWRHFQHLNRLNLSHNAITQLTSIDMNWSSSAVIDFSFNNITNIQPHVYLETSAPSFILNNNAFSCDCALYPFIKARQDSKSVGILRENYLICSSPPKLAGRPFSNLTGEELVCSECPNNCSCKVKITHMTDVFELNCSSVPLSFSSNDGFDLPIQLTLNTIPNNILNLSPRVSHLIMSNLGMTKLPYIGACTEVDLRHNLLSDAPFQLLVANCSVKLADNPFKCDCDNQVTFTFLKKFENQILDFPEVTCDGGLTVQNHLAEELCVTRNAILFGVGVSAGLLILGLCLMLIYLKSTLIKFYLIKYGLYCPKQDRRQTKYDAFVSYEYEDEKYVFYQLIPQLESGQRALRLCVPCRDWVVGGLIPDQIGRSVHESRVTIVVLSAHYGKSTWRKIEFRTAQATHRIIVLVMDDVSSRCSQAEFKTYTSINKCIKSSDTMAILKLKQAVGGG